MLAKPLKTNVSSRTSHDTENIPRPTDAILCPSGPALIDAEEALTVVSIQLAVYCPRALGVVLNKKRDIDIVVLRGSRKVRAKFAARYGEYVEDREVHLPKIRVDIDDFG